MFDASIPSIGDIVQFGSLKWEISSVERVICDYDPLCRYCVDLIIRDDNGDAVNFATNIPDSCLG